MGTKKKRKNTRMNEIKKNGGGGRMEFNCELKSGLPSRKNTCPDFVVDF